MIENIQWLGHGSFIVHGPPFIYINPWRVGKVSFLADVILVGHDHYEHFSVGDIQKLSHEHTRVFSNVRVQSEYPQAEIIRPWNTVVVQGASIQAIPAYSTTSLQHDETLGGLGFLISVNRYDIYYAGDTQVTPDTRKLRPDIAILPVDGNGTMTLGDVISLAKETRPRWLIPSNWGRYVMGATYVDVQRLKAELEGITTVVIPSSR
ncbi:MAG: MBL fold metallo-hydrolase [Phototrophicaceae bacterium]